MEQSEARAILLEQSQPCLGDELSKIMELETIDLDPFFDEDDDNVLDFDLEELPKSGFYNEKETFGVDGYGSSKIGESTKHAANRISKSSSCHPTQPMRLEVLRGKRVSHYIRSLSKANPDGELEERSIEPKKKMPRLLEDHTLDNHTLSAPHGNPSKPVQQASPSTLKQPMKKKHPLLDPTPLVSPQASPSKPKPPKKGSLFDSTPLVSPQASPYKPKQPKKKKSHLLDSTTNANGMNSQEHCYQGKPKTPLQLVESVAMVMCTLPQKITFLILCLYMSLSGMAIR